MKAERQIDRKLSALADPTRRALLRRTWGREVSAGDLGLGFAMTRSAVSQHLQVLRAAGLVRVRHQGTSRFYRADPSAVDEVRTFFDGFWDVALSDLKAAAEAQHRDKGGESS